MQRVWWMSISKFHSISLISRCLILSHVKSRSALGEVFNFWSSNRIEQNNVFEQSFACHLDEKKLVFALFVVCRSFFTFCLGYIYYTFDTTPLSLSLLKKWHIWFKQGSDLSIEMEMFKTLFSSGQPLPPEMTLAQLLTLLYERKLPQGYRSIDLTVKLGSKVISDPGLSKTDSFKRLRTEKGIQKFQMQRQTLMFMSRTVLLLLAKTIFFKNRWFWNWNKAEIK